MYVPSFSKLKRLDAITRSPIIYHLGESLAGISTIRLYKAEKRFIKKMEQKIDENNQVFYSFIFSNL